MLSINIYTLKQIRLSHHRYDLDLQVTNPKTCHHILDLLLDLKREPVEKFGIYTFCIHPIFNMMAKIIGFRIFWPSSCSDEYKIVISLNTKHKLLGLHILGIGNLESVIVEPREVFKAAMTNNAFAIIAFHNHPSGDPEPSAWDMAITRRLKDVGDFLNIRLVDHIIVKEGKWFSMKEGKLL